jgi:hypothetical protein
MHKPSMKLSTRNHSFVALVWTVMLLSARAVEISTVSRSLTLLHRLGVKSPYENNVRLDLHGEGPAQSERKTVQLEICANPSTLLHALYNGSLDDLRDAFAREFELFKRVKLEVHELEQSCPERGIEFQVVSEFFQ